MKKILKLLENHLHSAQTKRITSASNANAIATDFHPQLPWNWVYGHVNCWTITIAAYTLQSHERSQLVKLFLFLWIFKYLITSNIYFRYKRKTKTISISIIIKEEDQVLDLDTFFNDFVKFINALRYLSAVNSRALKLCLCGLCLHFHSFSLENKDISFIILVVASIYIWSPYNCLIINTHYWLMRSNLR